MPKQRIVDSLFWDDSETSSLSRDSRLLLLAMITMLSDDHGRLIAEPGYLKRKVFSEDQDLGRDQVKELRDEIIEKCRNVTLYSVNGQDYIWLSQFQKWQKIRYKVDSHLPEFGSVPAALNGSANYGKIQEFPRESVNPSEDRTSEINGNVPQSAGTSGTRVARAVGLGSVEKTPLSPPKRGGGSRSRKRSYSQIEAALGPIRSVWWMEFWSLFPCHSGKLPAMNAFERKIATPEIWDKCRAGVIRYVAKCRADPTITIKYAQGWINDERWDDEESDIPRETKEESKEVKYPKW